MKRNTWQRDAVRNALESHNGFVSAQSLFSDLRGNGSNIGLATVYRALNDLTSAGQADSLQSPEGESLFRACSTGHHHHLICRHCGLTVEIEARDVEEWAQRTAASHGFRQAEHVVDIFGVCATCSSTVPGSEVAPSDRGA